MTGPVTPPPPSGPGRLDEFDDSDLYLATVGCEVVDPLAAWAEALAAAAPSLTGSQGDLLRRVFGGSQ